MVSHEELTLSPDDLKRLAEIVGWESDCNGDFWERTDRSLSLMTHDGEVTPYGMESIKEYLRGLDAFLGIQFAESLLSNAPSAVVGASSIGPTLRWLAIEATPDDYGHAVLEMGDA